MAKALNLRGNATPEQIAQKFATATDAQKKKLKGLSVGGNETVQRLMGYTPVSEAKTAGEQKDFWIDGRGNLWSIDPQDFPTPLGGGALAMTKPGGPVAEYVNTAIRGLTGLGGGQSTTSPSGNFNITVNVDGSKNPVDTGRQVVREIKKAQDVLTGGTR